MADILLPQYLPVAQLDLGVQDGTAADVSPVTGLAQTSELFGVRKRTASLQFQNIDRRSGNLAVLRSFLSSMQGRKNRVWISDPAYQQRGSFPAPELLTNNDFSNGTTGWNPSAQYSATASDRSLRLTRSQVTALSAAVTTAANQTVLQHAPYAARAMIAAGQGSAFNLDITNSILEAMGPGLGSSSQMIQRAYVPPTTSMNFGVIDYAAFGPVAGDFFTVTLTSLSRCALADGGVNAFSFGNSLSNAAWGKFGCSVVDNYGLQTAPDGTLTATQIISSSLTNYVDHVVATVPTEAADYFFSVAVRQWTTSFARLEIVAANFSVSSCGLYVNLITGAVTSTFVGAAWSNFRSSVTSLGDGWFLVSLCARKLAGVTQITPLMTVSASDGVQSASGIILVWRPTSGAGSAFGRLVSTGATTFAIGTNQTGTAIPLKGLPASTNGLLLAGDRVQIGSRLREVVAPLNSNAAGQGLLMLDEPIPGGVADNAPVIVNNPMGRFMLAGDIGLSLSPGVFGNSSLSLVEA